MSIIFADITGWDGSLFLRADMQAESTVCLDAVCECRIRGTDRRRGAAKWPADREAADSGRAEYRITNATAGDGSRVMVVILLYDAEENLVGKTDTWLDGGLKAGDTIGFSMPTFGANGAVNVDTITGYRLYAYPVQDQY